MPDDSRRRRRYAIVGAGARAEMFARAVDVIAMLDRESVGVAVATTTVDADRPGGPDPRLLASLLVPGLPGGAGAGTTGPVGDELGRSATERDGARARLVGPAANESRATGRAVRVADLLDLSRSPLSAPRTAPTSTERTSTAPRDRKEQAQ